MGGSVRLPAWEEGKQEPRVLMGLGMQVRNGLRSV